ncbi:MAG: YdcF family protein [Chloroflexaceae bacterium]|nr:YdcF family protein [Chloroflexaceae bacterium]
MLLAAGWLAVPPQPRPADVIVVLGGYNVERLQTGVQLYRQGLASRLWHTGHGSDAEGQHFAAYTRFFAEAEGLPADRLTLLESASTWEDAAQIGALARERQVRRLLVVTHWFHSRRALRSINQQLAGTGVEIAYIPAEATPFQPDNWWHSRAGWQEVTGELLKLGFYWVYYGVTPWGDTTVPGMLGPKGTSDERRVSQPLFPTQRLAAHSTGGLHQLCATA